MTIRFTDKDKFHDKWYRGLTPVHKCMWEYFVSECNHAGILELDIRAMSFMINADITEDDVRYFEREGKIQILSDDKLFIPNFVLFQQRINSLSELNPNNRCHKSIIEQLKKYNVNKHLERTLKGARKDLENSETVSTEENLRPIEAPSKDLERGISKGICKGNSKSNSNIDIYCNKDYEKLFEIYQNECTELIPIRFERRSKAILDIIRDFWDEINYDFDYFRDVCRHANSLKKIVDTTIDFKMLLKNHAGIMNGKYKKVGKSVSDYSY